MKTIAIIPARGGSKRLPNKNILDFDGKPLLAYSIEFALEHNSLIDAVYVSTDDHSIKEIALAYGAEVIDRPSSLSTDDQPTITTLQHALKVLPNSIANIILLQPTNPLRPKNLLPEAFQKYDEGNYDSLMTVTANHQKLGKIINGNFIPFNYTFGQRSQDMEPLYYENGLLYIMKTDIVHKGGILAENNCSFIMDHPFANIDIDTKEDFEFAEYLLNKYKK